MIDQNPSPDMMIDAVDGQNRPYGKVRRDSVFKTDAGFRTVHVFVLDSRGRVLLQQQSERRDRAPLAWGSSVAGYLFAGESYRGAARRRMRQELGIGPGRLRQVGTRRVEDLGHDKFVGLFTAQSDGPFSLDPAHSQQVRFFGLEEVSDALKNGSLAVTPTFKDLFAFYSEIRGQSASGRR